MGRKLRGSSFMKQVIWQLINDQEQEEKWLNEIVGIVMGRIALSQRSKINRLKSEEVMYQ